MAPYNKHILTLFLTLIFISVKINAQEVRVIDNKGTIVTVNNNRVYTSATNPNTVTFTPLENDIWFDTTTTPNIVKIWDKTTNDWKVVNDNAPHTGTTGSVFFAAADGTPTEDNGELFWDTSINNLHIGAILTSGNSDSNKINVRGTVRATKYKAGTDTDNGTADRPSYTFFNDVNTGMYGGTNVDELNFSTGGIHALLIDASQNISIPQNLSVTGTYADSSGDTGTAGQILSSIGAGTGTNWVDNNTVTTNNTGTSPPLPIEGDVWFDTLNSEIKIYDTIDGWKLITSTSASGNIYTTNGTLTTDRTVTGAGLGVALTFSNINGFTLNSINSNIYNAAGSNVFSAGSSTTITSAASNVFTSTAATLLRSTSGIVEIFGATGIDLVSNTNVTGNISVTGTYADSSGDTGTDGQILSSIGAGAGTNWIDPPTIKAMGKIAANGNEIKITTDYTVTKAGLGNGRYQINIPAAMQTNANYIIQLTAFANGNGNDDYIVISYYDQTTANFKVEIKNYNGGRRNKPFMFTILDF